MRQEALSPDDNDVRALEARRVVPVATGTTESKLSHVGQDENSLTLPASPLPKLPHLSAEPPTPSPSHPVGKEKAKRGAGFSSL